MFLWINAKCKGSVIKSLIDVMYLWLNGVFSICVGFFVLTSQGSAQILHKYFIYRTNMLIYPAIFSLIIINFVLSCNQAFTFKYIFSQTSFVILETSVYLISRDSASVISCCKPTETTAMVLQIKRKCKASVTEYLSMCCICDWIGCFPFVLVYFEWPHKVNRERKCFIYRINMKLVSANTVSSIWIQRQVIRWMWIEKEMI